MLQETCGRAHAAVPSFIVDIVGLRFGNVSAPIGGNVSSMVRSGKLPGSPNFKSSLLARLCCSKVTSLHRIEYNLLDSQVAVIQKENEAVALERDECNANVGGLQLLSNRNGDSSNDAANGFNDEDKCLEAGRAATDNKAKGQVIQFLHVLVFPMKECAG